MKTTTDLTIYFHIGQPKTGSSAIQAFLNHNRENLLRYHGLLYPNFSGDDYATGDFHNHAAYFAKIKREDQTNDCIEQFIRCKQYCLANNIRSIIISNEGFFWYWWPELIKMIKDEVKTEVKMILYIRRQDYYIESAWKQWGHKDPKYQNIENYIENTDFDWIKSLKPWLQSFNPEDFLVFPFEKESIGEDVVAHFMGIFKVTDFSNLSQPPKTSLNTNYGFSPEIMEILARCKSDHDDFNDHTMINFLAEKLPSRYIKTNPFVPYGILSPAKRYEIVLKYRESNQQLEKLFGVNAGKGFFQEAMPDPEMSWTDEATLTLGNLTPVIMNLLVAQHQEIQMLKKSILYSTKNQTISLEKFAEKTRFINQLEHIRHSPDFIEFIATGMDPFMILPRIKTHNEKLIIKIILTAPSVTTAQIFFRTNYLQSFNEERSVRQRVFPGLNALQFIIASRKIAGKLRFDPGCHPGKYIIHSFEISYF